MAAKNKQGQKWAVKNGRAVLVTPAVKAAEEEVPVARLDREIERTARRKVRAQAQLDQAQAELDELTQVETELAALRAQLPA